MLYLDASALVKLAVPEPESAALLDALRGIEARISSVVAAVDVVRAVLRLTDDPAAADRAELVIADVDLLWLDSEILSTASRIEPGVLRSLDAIHLASALSLGDDLTGFVVYDRRLREAAAAYGLPLLSPG